MVFNSLSWKYSTYLPLCLQDLPDMVSVKEANFADVDAVFCCLPHGTTQVSFNPFSLVVQQP